MLIAVRHGQTAMNGDGSGEKSRSWLPVPLTLEGMQEAADTAHALTGLSPVTLYTSDLVRAVQAAQEIGRALKMEIQPRLELRDWNVGHYAGQDVQKMLPMVHAHIDHPQTLVPGGEPYQAFLARAIPFLKLLVESPQPYIGVTHNRVMTLLDALSRTGGRVPDLATLKSRGPVHPSGVLVLAPDWSTRLKSSDPTQIELARAVSQPTGQPSR
jgi:broad specificity phosphatase PhoE